MMKFMRFLLPVILAGFFVAPAQAAFEFTDIACESTTTTGTGTLDLGGAASGGYLGFAAAGISSGATVPYSLRSGVTVETGRGVFTDASPDTLTRVADWSTDGTGAELNLAAPSTVCVGPIAAMFKGEVADFGLNSLTIATPLAVSEGGTGQSTEAEALGEMTQALTEDTAPVYTDDFVSTYDASADTGKKVLLKNLRGAGEFFWYTAAATCPSYSLILSGGTVSRTTYARLWAAVSAVAQGSPDDADYGTGDGSTTFRLPNLTTDDHFIRAGTFGTEQADGAPNITGSIVSALSNQGPYGGGSGALSTSDSQTRPQTGSGSGNRTVSFDASDSNAKYGAASEIRPTNVAMTPCVVF